MAKMTKDQVIDKVATTCSDITNKMNEALHNIQSGFKKLVDKVQEAGKETKKAKETPKE
jgi:uncharacterized protein Yka (UPF0111/DUF47 family)